MAIEVKCTVCKKQLTKRSQKLFCSIECRATTMRTRQYFNCLVCKKEFWRVPSQVKLRPPKFCNKQCKGKYMSVSQKGESNNWWRGGVSSENRRIRYSAAMHRWRVAVFTRDNYTCVECGARNGNGVAVKLNADHIKPFAFFPELRFELDNGRTLCVPCHKLTGTYGVRTWQKVS